MRTRATLLWGYLGLLVLIAASGAAWYANTRVLAQSHTRLRDKQWTRIRSLDRLREDIYLSGTYARDAILAPGPAGVQPMRETLKTLARDSAAQLGGLADEQLAAEIRIYWQVLDLLFEVAPRERAKGVDLYFYRQLVERRDRMLALTDGLARMIAKTHAEEELEAARAAGRSRNAALALWGVTLAAALLLAWLTYRRFAQLETASGELRVRLQRAQEDERKAVARELHDEVGGSLSALLVETRAGRLEAAREIAERCAQTVRELAVQLRPSILDDLGLSAALEWLAREATRAQGVEVRVNGTGDLDTLDDDQKTCLYRVAQEALYNVSRHAKAGKVSVEAGRSGNWARLEVKDDGQGFDAVRTAGLGLLGMRERVEGLNGRLSVSSRAGAGTRILAELPL